MHERGQHGDADYAQISGRLHGCTASNLKDMKAKWHRKCYGSTCHSGHLERANAQYEKVCQEGESQHLQRRRGWPSSAATSVSDSAENKTLHFTRSATSFNAKQCFFCQEDRKELVHEVCTFSAGKQLQKAVDESKNQTWKVQLSSTSTKSNARAIDVKYHFLCWVQNVQHGATSSSKDKASTQEEATVGKVISDIEFVSPSSHCTSGWRSCHHDRPQVGLL